MAEIDAGGQLAMFQKLLNSPLGALGKSMLGAAGSHADRAVDAAPGLDPGNCAGARPAMKTERHTSRNPDSHTDRMEMAPLEAKSKRSP